MGKIRSGRTRREKRRKREKRHIIRNLSLRWSFALYIILCVAIALVLSISFSAYFSTLQNSLYDKYADQYSRQVAHQGALVVEGVIIDDNYWMYAQSIVDMFSERDYSLYTLYGAIAVFSVPVACLACILGTSLLFYRRKLKQPLKLFDEASARIAQGDLDFVIAYDNRNEMGRLARSFDAMRASLKENNSELWRMMEGRKRLNAAFAHDLRTPLTVLLGYADYLLQYVPQGKVPEAKQMDTLLTMRAYIQRLQGYTTSMSSLQRLDELTPNGQTLDFAALCEHLRGTADMLRAQKHLVFSCVGKGPVCVDVDMLVQVLENLMANAARYARETITVAIARREDSICLTVSDDGPGFSAEILPQAAAAFYHEPYADANSAHFGIGLYICSLFCAKHGGSLTLPEKAGESRIEASFRLLDCAGGS